MTRGPDTPLGDDPPHRDERQEDLMDQLNAETIPLDGFDDNPPRASGTERQRRAPIAPAPPHRTTSGRDAVTTEEREAAPSTSPAMSAIEADEHRIRPEQLALVDHLPRGSTTPLLGGLAPLESTSSLPLARSWYRRELEQARRPKNTIESYSYDLQTLETLIGPKPLRRIDRTDIARYLGEAETRSTRKRRLTTVRRFFRYLIDDARVLKIDPTEGFFPHQITLRLPVPLFPNEQEALMDAADADEPWSSPAIHLMLRLGLTRGELLELRPEHIDRSDPQHPVVFVGFETIAKRGLERRMGADDEFLRRLDEYLAAEEPMDRLFPVGPPAVNAMVDRVRKRAGLAKGITPQTLRYTFAVEHARQGADTDRLLELLGLVDDPRNRSSVGRYLQLASPPLE